MEIDYKWNFTDFTDTTWKWELTGNSNTFSSICSGIVTASNADAIISLTDEWLIDRTISAIHLDTVKEVIENQLFHLHNPIPQSNVYPGSQL